MGAGLASACLGLITSAALAVAEHLTHHPGPPLLLLAASAALFGGVTVSCVELVRRLVQD